MHLLTKEDIQKELSNHPIAGEALKGLLSEHLEIKNTLTVIKKELHHLTICKGCYICQDIHRNILKNFTALLGAEKHHQREEEVLHSELKKRGIFGTIERLHDKYSGLKSDLDFILENLSSKNYSRNLIHRASLFVENYYQLIEEEELVLYPTSIDVLQSKEDWKHIQKKFSSIDAQTL